MVKAVSGEGVNCNKVLQTVENQTVAAAELGQSQKSMVGPRLLSFWDARFVKNAP